MVVRSHQWQLESNCHGGDGDDGMEWILSELPWLLSLTVSAISLRSWSAP